MKKQFTKLFTIAICIVAFTVITDAQTNEKNSSMEIPFDFIVKNKVFPAGEYSLKRLNKNNPNFLILKKSDGKFKALFLTQSFKGENKTGKSYLMFKRYDKSYFLAGVWNNKEKQGYRLLQSKSEKRLKKNKRPKIVKLIKK